MYIAITKIAKGGRIKTSRKLKNPAIPSTVSQPDSTRNKNAVAQRHLSGKSRVLWTIIREMPSQLSQSSPQLAEKGTNNQKAAQKIYKKQNQKQTQIRFPCRFL